MIVKRYGIIVSVILLIAAQPIFSVCIPIDAISSATSYKVLNVINGSSACETTASIKWNARRSGGTGYFEYGTSTSYGSPRSTIADQGGTVNISGLTANTTYYYHIFLSKSGHSPGNLNGTFKTSGSETGVLNNISSGKQIAVSIGKTQFFIPFNDEKAITVSLFSLDGALLMKRTVSVANVKMDRSVHLGSQMSGTYICKVHTQAGEISQKIVLQK